MVSDSYFQALEIQAQIGRLLEPVKEAEDGAPLNAAVLSDRFWRQSFQADPRMSE